jgi:hypothetical protein
MLVLLFIAWILISQLEVKLDTRIPEAELRWRSIGHARIWFENEWRLAFRILFFSKTLPISQIKTNPSKPKKGKSKQRSVSSIRNIPGRMINVLRSFELTKCTVALDTGDNALTASLYPLNFAPYLKTHLFMNFQDENYLVLMIRNRPWKMIYAFFRSSFN